MSSQQSDNLIISPQTTTTTTTKNATATLPVFMAATWRTVKSKVESRAWRLHCSRGRKRAGGGQQVDGLNAFHRKGGIACPRSLADGGQKSARKEPLPPPPPPDAHATGRRPTLTNNIPNNMCARAAALPAGRSLRRSSTACRRAPCEGGPRTSSEPPGRQRTASTPRLHTRRQGWNREKGKESYTTPPAPAMLGDTAQAPRRRATAYVGAVARAPGCPAFEGTCAGRATCGAGRWSPRTTVGAKCRPWSQSLGNNNNNNRRWQRQERK